MNVFNKFFFLQGCHILGIAGGEKSRRFGEAPKKCSILLFAF
jgi:hypothetical protein